MSRNPQSPARKSYEIAYRLERLEAQPDTSPALIAQTMYELSGYVFKGARSVRLNATASFVEAHHYDLLERPLGFVKDLWLPSAPYRHSLARPASRLPGVSPAMVQLGFALGLTLEDVRFL